VETCSLLLELGAQFNMVENLAVEHHPHRPILVVNGLIAAADIDDAEAGMRQTAMRVVIEAVTIRPAMLQRVNHELERAALRRCSITQVQNAGDAAHDQISSSARVMYQWRPSTRCCGESRKVAKNGRSERRTKYVRLSARDQTGSTDSCRSMEFAPSLRAA